MEVSIFRNFWDKQPVASTLEETVEAFVEQGYERKTYRNTRGYIVMRRTADEMRSIRYVMAHEATSETAIQANTHTDDTDVF